MLPICYLCRNTSINSRISRLIISSYVILCILSADDLCI
nr:MAG TPA: hypothetical protein [Caudoviricetes sp.]DAW32154.1 MAG TPA: hypothetical protein [Caudoviricetes sp.]